MKTFAALLSAVLRFPGGEGIQPSKEPLGMTITQQNQPNLFDPPPYGVTLPLSGAARHTDGPTSHQAATNAKGRIRWGSQRAWLLNTYAEAGASTDEEAGALCGMSHEQATRRISELLKARLLEDTGEVRNTRAGNPARICKITVDGFRALVAAKTNPTRKETA